MTEQPAEQPIVTRSFVLSPVWLVPLAAVCIALTLAYQAWQEKGPLVEISFVDASGIVPGKTRILYKHVDVGLVEQVRLSQDLNTVVVKARLNPEMSNFLYPDTRFWIVTPRISLSGISGLNTLFSGAYIEMEPGHEGEHTQRFTGLDQPPTVRSVDQGQIFNLRADSLGSVDIGSPVYHRQVKVGEVTSFRLSAKTRDVDIQVFIEAPHHELIKQNTHFWNVSGVGLELNSEGFKAQLESVNSLISGGIAFDSPRFGEQRPVDPENDHFYLYPNKNAVAEGVFNTSYFYRLQFKDSIRGLTAGAPVEFLGIKVGEVMKVGFDVSDADNPKIEVIIALQPARFSAPESYSKEELDQQLSKMVGDGLRAQLKTGNLLTGKLYVDLVNEGGEPGQLIANGPYQQIPTTSTEFKQITRQLGNIVTKLDALPLQTIGANLDTSLAKLQKIISDLEQAQVATKIDRTLSQLEASSQTLPAIMDNANSALIELRTTLSDLEGSISPDSPLYYHMLRMAKQVGDAAQSMQQLSQQLQRDPQSLILGHEATE